MKSKYQEHLKFASSIENHTEKLMYLTSLLRSLLQLAVITTFELTKKETPYDEVGLIGLMNRFSKPVDGLPLEIFTNLTPTLRTYSSSNFLWGWFEPTEKINEPLFKQLQEWVEFRNQRPAHGVVDIPTAEEWSQRTENIIKNCLVVFKLIIPSIAKDGTMRLSREFKNFEIITPLLHKNHIFVVLNIASKRGVWKLKGQLISYDNAEKFTLNLQENNIFSSQGLEPIEKYSLEKFISNNQEHMFFHNIPTIQTDTFVGRTLEIEQLKEWMDDEDSRFCLVFGDGGYGKTTLVLEFFNQMINDEFDFEKSPPEIITYYTAKKTRWNEEGLTYFEGINLVMDECIRDLMRYFYPVLSKDWFGISGRQIIDKAVGVLKEHNYTRNDILFIIDNTETLASTQEEVKELGSFFKQIGKILGRVIITSRRREFIEATPLLIEGLTEEESVRLMRELAKVYNAQSIKQSGERTLRKVSKQLMQKPLLLEALVKYIAHSNLGIEEAMRKIFKKSNEELLEFLYEDAWSRMNDLQKEVFFVMIHLKSPLNQDSIGKICQEVEIQYSEFSEALEETHFAIEIEHTKNYTLQLIPLSERFFQVQFKKLENSEKRRFKKIAENVDSYSKNREKIERAYKTDRVAEAFRSEYAKSARVYADNGEDDKAFEMYELAIEDDPLNSALHDKFSWFLLNKTQDFEYAKILSEKAVELDTNNCDATVGVALALYRLGDISNGDKYIDKASKIGRTLSFCYLRKGIARYHQSKKINNLNESINLLEDALKFLNNSESKNLKSCGYDYKDYDDAIHYIQLTTSLLTNSRRKYTNEKKRVQT